jgi:hypothetical protein
VPNPNAAPMTPGKLTINLTPGQERIDIDGYRLEMHVTALKLMYDARTRKPVLLLDLLPSTVDVTAPNVSVQGEFREFLIQQGWQPPR